MGFPDPGREKKLILLIGGTLAAVAGAFASMGMPDVTTPMIIEGKTDSISRQGDGPNPLKGTTGHLERARKPGKLKSRPNTRPRTGNTFIGRVLGPLGPLQNVPIELIPPNKAGEPQKAVFKILSRRRGVFEFKNIPINMWAWAVRIHAPGFGVCVKTFEAFRRDRGAIVELFYGRWVSGKVQDQMGHSVAGCRVELGLPLPNAKRVIWTHSGTSGPRGSIVGKDLPVNRSILLVVDRQDYSPTPPRRLILSASGPLPEVNFVLKKGREVSGVVTDSRGRPLPGKMLIWERKMPWGFIARRTALSDKRGNFTLCGLPLDNRKLEIWIPMTRGGRHKVCAKPGRSIELILP